MCNLLNKTQLKIFESSCQRWLLASTSIPLPTLRFPCLELIGQIRHHSKKNMEKEEDGSRILHAQALLLSLSITYDFKQHGLFGRIVRLLRTCRSEENDVPVDRLVNEILHTHKHNLREEIFKVLPSSNDQAKTLVKTLCEDLESTWCSSSSVSFNYSLYSLVSPQNTHLYIKFMAQM